MNGPDEAPTPTDADRLYKELHAVISKYGDVTVFETVGALEAVKLDVLDELKRWNEPDHDPSFS